MNTWIKGSIALSLALCAPHALGQETTAKEQADEPVELTEVIVRGTPVSSTDGDLRNSAVVTNQEIMEQNAGSVVDAVREQAGVSIQQTTPGQGTIYVRGFSGRAVGHTVDGVRLNTAIYRAGNNPYLALVDPYSLKRIAIEPGATSVEYGSDALGGAVLMSTTTPTFKGADDASPPLPTIKLYQSFSTNPLGSVSHADLTQRFGRITYNVGTTYIRDRDIRPGGGALSPDPESYVGLERNVGEPYKPQLQRSQEGTEFEFFGANATVQYAIRSWIITAKGQLGLRPTLERYDRIVPLFKEEHPSRSEATSQPMSRGMASVTFRHTSDNTIYNWSELLLAWQGISETNLDRRFNEECLDDPAPLEGHDCLTRQRLTPDTSMSKEINRSDAGSLRWVSGFALGKKVNLRVGLDLHLDRIGSHSWETDLLTAETEDVTSRFPNGSVMSEGGLFAKMGFRQGKLRGYAGVRGMGFHIALPDRDGHESFDKVLFDYSLGLGLRYDLTPHVGFIANLGRGVRMPNIADFSGLGARAQGRYQLPNTNITPEHSYTADVGVKVRTRKFTINSFVFGSRYADAIILAPTTLEGQSYSNEGDHYYHSENAARIDYLGLDLSFHAYATTVLDFFGRYLAMMGLETNPSHSGLPVQTPADRVPPYQGELGVEASITPKLELRFWSRLRAKQQRLNDPVNLDDNRIPDGGTPGYITFHARAVYQLLQQLETFLLLDNLTNAQVLDHGSGFYGAGFSATLGLSLDTGF